jgi:hypothetical protein
MEQFGLAMMAPPSMPARACALTSGTTSGIASSYRNAEVLSITTAPARAARGANSLLTEPPAENNA